MTRALRLIPKPNQFHFQRPGSQNSCNQQQLQVKVDLLATAGREPCRLRYQFQCETGNGCGMNGVPTKAQVTANEVKASSKHLGSFPRISHDPVKFSRVAGHLWLRRQKNGSTWLHSSEAWQKGSLDPQSGRSGESSEKPEQAPSPLWYAS